MAEYIDREKIISETCGNCTRQVDLLCRHPEPCGTLIDAFLTSEAADVAPVVHGKWILNTDEFTPKKRCTNCGYNKPIAAGERLREEPEKYCPNCGAKMDAAGPQKGED